MNSNIATLSSSPAGALTKNILSKHGFNCSLIMLGRGEETAQADSTNMAEHLIFVIDGEATVRFGDVNTVVNKDEALLVPKEKEYSILAHVGWAKLLRVEVPPRQVITPQIITFDS
jgi:mannose-6-phosphate isomerase-like protein (cupin superfamily)